MIRDVTRVGISWWRSSEMHPTILAAEFAARETLVVDEKNIQQRIDLGPVCHPPTSGSSRHGSNEGLQRTEHTHGDGKYFLPNDQVEHGRLDLQHQIYLTTLDGALNLAPIKKEKVKQVLDIGTGTGIWAVDFAQQNPGSQVLGFDLNAYTPAYMPPNCKLEVHDAEESWPFEKQFDFIHGRSLATCFESHAAVFQNAFQALNPGSYFEMQDCIVPMRSVDSTYPGSATEKWHTLTVNGAIKMGRDMTSGKDYKTYMEQAGFVDVVEKHFQWPLGLWTEDRKLKAIGVLFREDMERVADSLSAKILVDGLGMTEADVGTLLSNMRSEWRQNKVHTYLPMIVVYGRKPE